VYVRFRLGLAAEYVSHERYSCQAISYLTFENFTRESRCIVYNCNCTAHGVQITVCLTAKVVFYHISHQLEQHFVNHDCFTRIVTNACKIAYCDTFARSTDGICIQKSSEMHP